jgi:hypothetical protein
MKIGMKVRASVFSTCLLAGASLMVTASLPAQGYLTGAALNKKIVTDFYRVVFEPRNVDLLDQYIAPDFVEHNPAVESGKSGGDRSALAAFIKTLPKPASDDIGSEMSKRLVNSVLICPEVWYSRDSNLGGGSEWFPVMRHQFTQPGDRVTGDA